MQLGFFDLYSIYRLQGWSIVESIRLAWQYRNFVPDHSGSRAMAEQQRRCREEDERVVNMSPDERKQEYDAKYKHALSQFIDEYDARYQLGLQER